MSSFFEIKDLYVEYSSGMQISKALNGVNLSLERGETLGLVGETGAGKTTTALSVLKLLPERSGKIRSGEINFDGLNILDLNDTEMRAIRGERISMIFQDPMTSLHPLIPVGDQIEEALKLHDNTMGRESVSFSDRVDEILTMVGIPPERKKEYPHQFSGGMKQRVVIAIALACEPELLIADEPTTALDVTIQAQVLKMMTDLKEQLGMSMILITHDLGIVAKNCDKVAVMYCGEIIESGTFEDFFLSNKHHPYTDSLFGSIPNIFSEEKRLHPIMGMPPDPTNLPEGCKFHDRCGKCTELCKTVNPETYSNGTHCIKCHLFKEEGMFNE